MTSVASLMSNKNSRISISGCTTRIIKIACFNRRLIVTRDVKDVHSYTFYLPCAFTSDRRTRSVTQKLYNTIDFDT